MLHGSKLSRIVVSLLATLMLFSQPSFSYKSIFLSKLPPQKQILTLPIIKNNTQTQVLSSSSLHQIILQNQPFQQIKQLIAINITYSQQVGFKSQWPIQKITEQMMKLLTGNSKEYQDITKIKCSVTTPQIVFKNKVQFQIQIKNKTHQHKIVTKYQELLNQQMVLDVWVQPNNNTDSLQSRIFMVMSDGNLMIVRPFLQSSANELRYQTQKIRLSKQFRDAQFNSELFVRQRKVYVFSNQVQVQLIFADSIGKGLPQQFEVNFMKIQRHFEQNQKLVDFGWIFVQENKPRLSLMTKEQLMFYQYDPEANIYRIVQNSTIGIKQVHDFLKVDQDKRKATGTLHLRQFVYYQAEDLIIIMSNSYGLILCQPNQQLNSVEITQVLTTMATSNCNSIFLAGGETYSNNQSLSHDSGIFYMNCDNGLIKGTISNKGNKNISVKLQRSTQVTVPTGQVVLISSGEGHLIFVKGQAGVVVFNSWRYPKTLYQQNMKADNFFVFGNKYISIFQNRVTLGQYQTHHQKVLCSYNQQHLNNNKNNTSQQSQKPTSTNTDSRQQPITLYIQYLAECNPSVLQSSKYNLTPFNYLPYQYCRYKKLYTQLYLEREWLDSQSTKNKPQIQVWLVMLFILAFFILTVGVLAWVWQKRKIRHLIQQQGLPVESEDLEGYS